MSNTHDDQLRRMSEQMERQLAPLRAQMERFQEQMAPAMRTTERIRTALPTDESGYRGHTFRCSDDLWERWKAEAERRGVTPAELLRQVMAKVVS